jgi:glutathione S-transferase
MKLYGNPLSTCTRKVLALVAEKGAKVDFVSIDIMKGEGQSADHLSRQPFGQIPAIDDDGFVLYESRAILRYLDKKLPGASLMPADAKAMALMEQWISVETSNFTPHAMKIIYETVFHPMMGKPTDKSKVDEARTALTRTLDIMERQLAKTTFIAGQTFTLADIGYMPYIEYVVAGGNGDLFESRTNVSRWWKAISSRPSWKTATGKN